MFAGGFAPRDWALCDGQLLAVSQNDALFSLLGTIYGGDGRSTFGLPDMRGRIPVHAGSGPGLSNRALGARGGAENVTLTVNQLPSHSHRLKASNDVAAEANPASDRVTAQTGTFNLYQSATPTLALAPQSITSLGGSQQHPNLQPFLCINYIIALYGTYPSRT